MWDEPAIILRRHMELPASCSLTLIGLPLVLRLPLALRWREVFAQPIPRAQERVEQHRSMIGGLAGFSLAGIALIGVQAEATAKLGAALFDIVASFLLSLAALGIQTWKHTRLHDLIGDGLRDAATTALLLFALRVACAVASDAHWDEGWQVPAVAILVGVAWLVDPVMNFVTFCLSIPSLVPRREGAEHGEQSRPES
jgi:hypothetical protein